MGSKPGDNPGALVFLRTSQVFLHLSLITSQLGL